MSSNTNADCRVGPPVAVAVATQPVERHADRTAHCPVDGVAPASGFPLVPEGPKSARYTPVKGPVFAGAALVGLAAGGLACSVPLVNTMTSTTMIVAMTAAPPANAIRRCLRRALVTSRRTQ